MSKPVCPTCPTCVTLRRVRDTHLAMIDELATKVHRLTQELDQFRREATEQAARECERMAAHSRTKWVEADSALRDAAELIRDLAEAPACGHAEPERNCLGCAGVE